MDLQNYIGENGFQHIAPQAEPLFGVIGGVQQPPSMLRKTGVQSARDVVTLKFEAKDYKNCFDKEVKADERILMGVICGCFTLQKVWFRGSEGDECAKYLNIKTGDGTITLNHEGEEVEAPINVNVLDVDEKDKAWPVTDLYLVRLDCPQNDAKTGDLAGIPIGLEAEKQLWLDSLAGRALGQTAGGSTWGVVAVVKGDVPPLASLHLDVHIANAYSL